MLVIFVGAAFVLIGLMAVVTDISWYWANTLKVQRAADAAALAGAVWLPDYYAKADTTARNTATAHGYTNGAGGTTVTTQQDPSNDRKLIVTINAGVPSFFARLFGINSFPLTKTAEAEFVLPVAMGSPENYYGSFGVVRGATFTGTTTTDTGFLAPTSVPSTVWTTPNILFNKTVDDNTTFATSTTTNACPAGLGPIGNFGIPAGATIQGIEVGMLAKLTAADPATNCTIGVQLSPNGGTNWYPATATRRPRASPRPTTSYILGANNANPGVWTGHAWVQADFGNLTTGFQVRLTWNRGSCAATETAAIDILNVRVTYTATTTTTTNNLLGAPNSPCPNGVAGCYLPDGSSLNARGFWADMGTQGTSNVNGDAYQSFYDTATSKAAKTCPRRQPGLLRPHQLLQLCGQHAAGIHERLRLPVDPSFCEVDDARRDQRSLAGGRESCQLVVRPVQHAGHPLQPRR